ncbi:MAG: sugar ABC transporter ATP-binding protein [Christensenellales bacterium]
MGEAVLLVMKNIFKSFPGVQALTDVSLDVQAGEVHALLGENGAGKSTLIKILAGIHKPDSGEIYINGNKVSIENTANAKKHGISVVHQELCLCKNMTVAENVFLGREKVKKSSLFCDDSTMDREAKQLLINFGLPLDPKQKLTELSIAQQQMVELAKAMSTDAKIIVLDEPTDTLTDKETESLFRLIRNLKERNVGIIYISHKIEELFEIADRVTVLRDGKYIDTKRINETTYSKLVNMLVGRELSEMYPNIDNKIGEPILEARNISRGRRVRNCSFSLNKGEILGFYGLIGSGRTELMRIIFGIDKPDSGEIAINGEIKKIRSVKDAMHNGISLVPENRKEQGLVLIQSVGYNITISILDKIFAKMRLKKNIENNIIANYIKKFSIRTPSVNQNVLNLSGGNQQKVVVSKNLATQPEILILDEPTRGIDVGVKKDMYEIIENLARDGVSIIMVSSELHEIVNMCNRVIVMYEGRIKGELKGSEITQEAIILKAVGGN